MQDPIADMLTRIRNGQRAKHPLVKLPSSIMKQDIAQVLKDEGYIKDFHIVEEDTAFKTLVVELKYHHNRPVIEHICRVSRPGLRIYKSVKEIKAVSGFGIAILSTSKGIVSHAVAKKLNVGGEVLCEVA